MTTKLQQAADESHRIDIPTVLGLLAYLNYQYPSTIGNIPLAEFCATLIAMEKERDELKAKVAELTLQRDDALTHERDAQKGAKINAIVADNLAKKNVELQAKVAELELDRIRFLGHPM